MLPKLGFSMEEANLVEWLVADGAQVKEGAALYVIESDKATQEVEAPFTGMLKIIAQPGEVYPVGTVLAEID
jgi:pyruvate/2-oxoglutarate dehydrogenase complex dihydrolipoamide acyltransferase (E2) component